MPTQLTDVNTTYIADAMQQHTQNALRAVIDSDGVAYEQAMGKLHPRRGEKGRILTTVFLCKAAIAIGQAKDPPFPDIPEEMEERIRGLNSTSFNWGSDFADRFTTAEAETLWHRFEPLDALLKMEEEHYIPGFQQRTPMRYHFNDMPANYTTADFIASWGET